MPKKKSPASKVKATVKAKSKAKTPQRSAKQAAKKRAAKRPAKSRPAVAPHALRGPWTVIYPAPDLGAARAFYAALLEHPPYFDEPFYVGFNVGGFELGLDPDLSARGPGSAGGLAYWGVADIGAALKRALELGASPVGAVKDVGSGIKVATVKDPFGSVIGLIENPSFSAV